MPGNDTICREVGRAAHLHNLATDAVRRLQEQTSLLADEVPSPPRRLSALYWVGLRRL
jgi:hypothetical protein